MLLKGVEYLVVGMSAVVLFLVLLVVVLMLVTYVIRKLNIDTAGEQITEGDSLSNAVGKEIAAAIAAIKNYNKGR